MKRWKVLATILGIVALCDAVLHSDLCKAQDVSYGNCQQAVRLIDDSVVYHKMQSFNATYSMAQGEGGWSVSWLGIRETPNLVFNESTKKHVNGVDYYTSGKIRMSVFYSTQQQVVITMTDKDGNKNVLGCEIL